MTRTAIKHAVSFPVVVVAINEALPLEALFGGEVE
jgi:hypothetical protein